jgi:hypothetical protein
MIFIIRQKTSNLFLYSILLVISGNVILSKKNEAILAYFASSGIVFHICYNKYTVLISTYSRMREFHYITVEYMNILRLKSDFEYSYI